ncbi:MAG: CpsB/CapC family capsule biosynthesis tyrosine phosphatase [Clostridiaceae bacterium]
MVDFHSHILFDVDDGSRDFSMSVRMIEESIHEGVTMMAVTPHDIEGVYSTEKEEYQEKFDQLKETFKGRIELIPSMEIMINAHLREDLKSGRVFGYNYSKTILVEFNLIDYPSYAEGIFYKLKKEGYQVILAHPERYKVLREDPGILYHLIDLGVIFQLNAGSLIGHFGEKVTAFAEKLVTKNLIHMVGSDGHNDDKRNTKIKYAYDRINELNPELYANIMENSPRIIKGEKGEFLPYKDWEKASHKKKRGFFNFFGK